MPEDIERLKRRWAENLEEIALQHKANPRKDTKHEGHDLFSFALANPPADEFDEDVFNVFLSISTSQKTIEILSNMQWGIVKFDSSSFSLYVSDRPIVRLSTLSSMNGALWLPISKDTLFVAANRPSDLQKYCNLKAPSNLKDANRLVVSQAYKYAYSCSDDCLRFMQNHLSTVHDSRAIEGR